MKFLSLELKNDNDNKNDNKTNNKKCLIICNSVHKFSYSPKQLYNDNDESSN
jgi:hypothetical protein